MGVSCNFSIEVTITVARHWKIRGRRVEGMSRASVPLVPTTHPQIQITIHMEEASPRGRLDTVGVFFLIKYFLDSLLIEAFLLIQRLRILS